MYTTQEEFQYLFTTTIITIPEYISMKNMGMGTEKNGKAGVPTDAINNLFTFKSVLYQSLLHNFQKKDNYLEQFFV